MEIQENKHYVSIPRNEYDRMLAIVERKRDPLVTLGLHLYDSHYRNFGLEPIISVVKFDLNTDLKFSEVTEVKQIINDAIKEVERERKSDVDKLNEELSEIKSKWWYKLFN